MRFLLPLLLLARLAVAQPRVVDDFERIDDWTAVTSDGATLRLSRDSGPTGHCLRLDFTLRGGGYVIARRALPLDLPADYTFGFRVRGEAPVNNLEFKLIDPSGDNVWWLNQRRFAFPTTWQPVTIRKRKLSFAWGPQGGGEMTRVGTLEFAVSSAEGGSGTVWLDELTFEPRAVPTGPPPAPVASASTGGSAAALIDDDPGTVWTGGGAAPSWVQLDLGRPLEFGGVTVDWTGESAADYQLQLSDDGATWTTAAHVTGSNGGRDDLPVTEGEARFLRLALPPGRFGIAGLTVQPPAFGASANAFLTAVAGAAPIGSYPRAYNPREQTYWTVLGADGDRREALMGEDGPVEVDKSRFTLEPFLLLDSALVTWHDVERDQTLADGYLPIPSVLWRHASGLRLQTTAFVAGPAGRSTLFIRYRVTNGGKARRRGTLVVGMRPVQVNPPWQDLNTAGGVAPIHRIERTAGGVLVDSQLVVPLTPADGFGASAFWGGELSEHLGAGRLPSAQSVSDSLGLASAGLGYSFDLRPGATQEVSLAVPFSSEVPVPARTAAAAQRRTQAALAATEASWRAKLDRVGFRLPPSAQEVMQTVRANLAYILINRDGPSLQPGSRSYERSWIRDGALTSSALLRFGLTDQVRDFLKWYAPFQYPSGKVPCCVDRRGADPVAEHDSNGEFLFLVLQDYTFRHDRAFLKTMWPHVMAATDYLDSLRQTRRTAEYRTDDKRVFFGLLPESISHEGYSAKPMHSYWDDFFALRGFRDATTIAAILGHDSLRAVYAERRDGFQRDLLASLDRVVATRKLTYLPGAADLGDFDATSTAIGISPGEALPILPEPALSGTFDRYWRFFVNRRDSSKTWENYTPYEVRLIGTFVRLGQRERAHELLDFFLRDRRPTGWRAWAEVVWREPRLPRFIGDMPHTWVGSDFLSSVRSMFVYEREADSSLVVGAGLPAGWLDDPAGLAATALPTEYGPLSFDIQRTGAVRRVRLSGALTMPPGGILLNLPTSGRVTLDGRAVQPDSTGAVQLNHLPATVVYHDR